MESQTVSLYTNNIFLGMYTDLVEKRDDIIFDGSAGKLKKIAIITTSAALALPAIVAVVAFAALKSIAQLFIYVATLCIHSKKLDTFYQRYFAHSLSAIPSIFAVTKRAFTSPGKSAEDVIEGVIGALLLAMGKDGINVKTLAPALEDILSLPEKQQLVLITKCLEKVESLAKLFPIPLSKEEISLLKPLVPIFAPIIPTLLKIAPIQGSLRELLTFMKTSKSFMEDLPAFLLTLMTQKAPTLQGSDLRQVLLLVPTLIENIQKSETHLNALRAHINSVEEKIREGKVDASAGSALPLLQGLSEFLEPFAQKDVLTPRALQSLRELIHAVFPSEGPKLSSEMMQELTSVSIAAASEMSPISLQKFLASPKMLQYWIMYSSNILLPVFSACKKILQEFANSPNPTIGINARIQAKKDILIIEILGPVIPQLSAIAKKLSPEIVEQFSTTISEALFAYLVGDLPVHQRDETIKNALATLQPYHRDITPILETLSQETRRRLFQSRTDYLALVNRIRENENGPTPEQRDELRTLDELCNYLQRQNEMLIGLHMQLNSFE